MQQKISSLRNTRNPPQTPPRPLTHNLHPPLLLQRPNRIRKLRPLNSHTTLLTQRPHNIPIPHTTRTRPEHLIQQPQHPSLKIILPPALTRTSTLSQKPHIDQTGAGICGGLLESGLDEADGFLDVFFCDGAA